MSCLFCWSKSFKNQNRFASFGTPRGVFIYIGENPVQIIGHSSGNEKDNTGGDKCIKVLWNSK